MRPALPSPELMQMSAKKGTLLLTVLAALLPGSRATAEDPRSELLQRINAERQRSGAPALRLLRPLSEVAQQHAEEIARSGTVQLPRGSDQSINERMRQAGYDAHLWVATSGTWVSVW